MAEYSAVASGAAASQAIEVREEFHGPDRICPRSPNHEGPDQNVKAEIRSEKRGIPMTKLTAKAEAKAEEGARVAQNQEAGL